MIEPNELKACAVTASQDNPKLNLDSLQRIATGTFKCWHSDAVYMACEIISLRAETAALRAENARLLRMLDLMGAQKWGIDNLAEIEAERDALAERCKALEGDKERLQAIEDNIWSVSWFPMHHVWVIQEVRQVCGNIGKAATLRAAIDAAKEAK